MGVDHTLRAGDAANHLTGWVGRRVGGKDRVCRRYAVELGEHRLLQFEPFRQRLDDQPGSGNGVSQSVRFDHLPWGEPPGTPSSRRGSAASNKPPGCSATLLRRRVEHADLTAAAREHQGDPLSERVPAPTMATGRCATSLGRSISAPTPHPDLMILFGWPDVTIRALPGEQDGISGRAARRSPDADGVPRFGTPRTRAARAQVRSSKLERPHDRSNWRLRRLKSAPCSRINFRRPAHCMRVGRIGTWCRRSPCEIGVVEQRLRSRWRSRWSVPRAPSIDQP